MCCLISFLQGELARHPHFIYEHTRSLRDWPSFKTLTPLAYSAPALWFTSSLVLGIFFFHLYNQGWLCIDCLSWIEWASLGQPPHPNLIDLARVPSPVCSACIWLSHQIRRINWGAWIKRDKEGIRPQAPIFKFHCPRCQSWDID